MYNQNDFVMRLNTIYKDFVAKSAMELFTAMVKEGMSSKDIDATMSCEDNKAMYSHLAMQATFAAKELADTLSGDWGTQDGTVFFDPDDTPLTGLRESIDDMNENVENMLGAVVEMTEMMQGEDGSEGMSTLQEIAMSTHDIAQAYDVIMKTSLHVTVEGDE